VLCSCDVKSRGVGNVKRMKRSFFTHK
jgi:hypothetical protein